MAKCKICGKRGLLLKVDSDKKCSLCKFSEEERDLRLLIEQQQQVLKSLEDKNKCLELEYNKNSIEIAKKLEIEHNKASIEIAKKNDQAKIEYDEAIAKILKLEDERQEILLEMKQEAKREILAENNEKLYEIHEKIALQQKHQTETQEELTKLQKERNTIQTKLYKEKSQYECYKKANKAYSKSACILSEVEIDPTIEIPLHCMNFKKLRSLFNHNKKLIRDCLTKYESRYTTKTNSALYKLMVIALEAELQNILYAINFGKLDKSISAVKEMTQKYLTIAIQGNQTIAPTMKSFICEIEHFFLEAVKIEYEYYVQKEQIKEEQRALREQARQDAEEKRLLEEERKKIEKEESKYLSEIENISEQLKNTNEDSKIRQLEERLKELTTQLNAVIDKKEEIIKLSTGKAGNVYIISNLGSFGDNVFKIGMTRRLNPIERINELGSASVPFSFDVHCFIFSDDAVGLENTLHKTLNNKRVNKINLRKEFFNVSVDELEEIVYKVQPSAEFNKTLLAEQYHQSLSAIYNE